MLAGGRWGKEKRFKKLVKKPGRGTFVPGIRTLGEKVSKRGKDRGTNDPLQISLDCTR